MSLMDTKEVEATVEGEAAPSTNAPPVDPQDFVTAMDHHWRTHLDNVSSDNLRLIWRQLAETWNAKIMAAETDPEDYARWKILQPSTGTGKTQGLALYCSMLPGLYDAPGVLIVTRLKTV